MATYYVKTDGSDNQSGLSDASAWLTWQKAFTSTSVTAGDTVYFKGGIYPINVSNGIGISVTRDGSMNNWIKYWADPSDYAAGNYPILDCSSARREGNTNNTGIVCEATYCVHFKGLTVKNVFQRETSAAPYNLMSWGWIILDAWGTVKTNVILENCTVHDIHGEAFFANHYGPALGPGGGTINFINCDAYNTCDYWTDDSSGNILGRGGHGTGFACYNAYGIDGSTNLIGCRSWNNSDQGYTIGGASYVTMEGCWSFDNRGYLNGEGNGCKMGWTNQSINEIRLQVKNNISANNDGWGFHTNDSTYPNVKWMNMFNNISYHNNYWGFGIFNSSAIDAEELHRVFKNNIAYANTIAEVQVVAGALYTHSNNSWDSSLRTIVDADFVSLDVSQLYRPRKANGSLPDVSFGHLTANSSAIYAGTFVDISTDAEGNPYHNPPSLGAYEYTGNLHYVAVDGSDNYSGTIGQPWRTWGKAFNSTDVSAGDTVYFRGGVYYKNLQDGNDAWYYPNRSIGGTGYNISRIGTPENTINYFAYPPDFEAGNFPILDCSTVILPTGPTATSHYGIRGAASYCHIKGLTIRNVYQRDSCINNIAAFETSGTNLTIENCNFNSGGTGLFLYTSYNARIINCDAWDCWDPYGDFARPGGPSPGNDGYGFMTNNDNVSPASSVYFINCRSWGSGDDGFAYYDRGYVENDGCWSFGNGRGSAGGGSGWKLGFSYWEDTSLRRVLKNSIAANNRAVGITGNDNGAVAQHMNIYNNLSFHNGYQGVSDATGFKLYNTTSTSNQQLLRILKNNISYDNEAGEIWNDGLYTHTNNTWDKSIGIEKILNGNFSNWINGDPSNWIVYGESNPTKLISEASTGGLRYYLQTGSDYYLRMYQYDILTVGTQYICTYDVCIATAGSIRIVNGATAIAYISSVGSYWTSFIASVSEIDIRGDVAAATNIVIDNLSVQELISYNDNDFINLDVSQLYRPRKTNGALPDVSFGHLAINSSLIHAGVYVGFTYDGDGSLWNNPPSIGAYEYSYTTPSPDVSIFNSKLSLYRVNNKIIIYNNRPLSF